MVLARKYVDVELPFVHIDLWKSSLSCAFLLDYIACAAAFGL